MKYWVKKVGWYECPTCGGLWHSPAAECPHCNEELAVIPGRSAAGPVMRVVLNDGAFMPTRAHADDAGLDLMSPIDCYVPGRGSRIIDTGVHIELPPGTVGMLKSKSGLNVKHNITSDGVIDVGYTGTIRVKLYNHGDRGYDIFRGYKISQLVILPIIVPELQLVDKLDDTERGAGGFGSTGR